MIRQLWLRSSSCSGRSRQGVPSKAEAAASPIAPPITQPNRDSFRDLSTLRAFAAYLLVANSSDPGNSAFLCGRPASGHYTSSAAWRRRPRRLRWPRGWCSMTTVQVRRAVRLLFIHGVFSRGFRLERTSSRSWRSTPCKWSPKGTSRAAAHPALAASPQRDSIALDHGRQVDAGFQLFTLDSVLGGVRSAASREGWRHKHLLKCMAW